MYKRYMNSIIIIIIIIIIVIIIIMWLSHPKNMKLKFSVFWWKTYEVWKKKTTKVI